MRLLILCAMESSGIPTRNHAKYSFITFNQSMSPMPESDPLDYSPGLTPQASNNGQPSLRSSSLSHPVQGVSEDACSNRDSSPVSIMIDDAEAKNENHITRPRNAFMIYRSECLAQNKITRDVEHDSRHISRIIGHCWQRLSREEKAIWKQKADDEKAEHKNKYPDYKFSPVPRSKKPLKRNGKRNGEKDMKRCKQVADLLLSGKEGRELAAAVKRIDHVNADDQQAAASIQRTTATNDDDIPVFLNPLRPPTVPSTEVYQAASSSNKHPIFYEPRPRSPRHYYPSPPVSPTSSNPIFRENTSSTRNPYHMGQAYMLPQSQATHVHAGNHPPVGPYHANKSFPHSTSFNALHFNEAQGAYTANGDTFLGARGYHTFQ